jgi:hypothetical protein
MGVGGQRHAPAALPPGRRPGTHCIVGWVGLRAGLDGCGKSRRHRDSIPGPSRRLKFLCPMSGHLTWVVMRWLYVSMTVIGKTKELCERTVGRTPCPDSVWSVLGMNPCTCLNCYVVHCPRMPWVRPLTSLQF